MTIFRKRSRINLALQGGGTHGAFTWGVLDRLLEEPSLEIGWISATSAGAINAVAVAAGLADGGRDKARAKLREIWDAVHRAGLPDLVRLNPLLFSLSRSSAFASVAQLWSPYEFNPLGFDPLRSLLASSIDFGAIRERSPIELLIAATEVASGHARLFRRHEISVEAVLASCCLPMIHHAVEIDGVAYWDGGFSANPDLVTLAMESPVPDTLIVQLSPLKKEGTPTGAREIQAHMNRLTFNAPLIRDVETIETAREALRGSVRSRIGRLRPLAQHRFHIVEAAPYTGTLSDDSKMKPDLALITLLYDGGRLEADRWIKTHRRDVGRRSTVDLRAHFEGIRSASFEVAPEERRRASATARRADMKQSASNGIEQRRT
ncbi:MAG: patatin-like phospholipase family protein [Hyphomicrobium sp.]|nr:patatin-like phospholipase family protein [Hyphomicrobium sp.]